MSLMLPEFLQIHMEDEGYILFKIFITVYYFKSINIDKRLLKDR